MSTQQLRNMCGYFLQIEERALLEGEQGKAELARHYYEVYRPKLDMRRTTDAITCKG
ncbi:hypothetical protein [Paenibacillus sp. D9]|uniref:hypothetical protein n=1 Tax=Paenibacillus sp. D9 TaxID=665792 RepID=UPI0012EE5781|nr:hypothetical protein [Paenibacillus sp. D9]